MQPSSAPKKAFGWSQPEQGKIAGDRARTTSPVGEKKSDPHASLKETAGHGGGLGANQAKAGSGKEGKMRYSRMV